MPRSAYWWALLAMTFLSAMQRETDVPSKILYVLLWLVGGVALLMGTKED